MLFFYYPKNTDKILNIQAAWADQSVTFLLSSQQTPSIKEEAPNDST